MRISNSNIQDSINNQQTTNTNASPKNELHNDVMRDTTMRETLKQSTDLSSHTNRLAGQYQQSRSDFQAQRIQQQVGTGLPASAPSTSSTPTIPTTDVTRDPNFQKLSSSQKASIYSALEKNRDNPAVISEFKAMLDNPAFFSKLTSNDRGYIINGMVKNPGALASDLIQFTQTDSYKGFSKMQRQQSQTIIGLLSADAANNPTHNPMSRNTVQLLVTGNVNMGVPTKAELKKEGFTDADLQGLYGFADGNTMYFNVYKPGILDSREDMERTASHEINHVLNDRTNDNEYDTPERALDEYRAWYVENFSVGISKPSVQYMQDVYQNFFGPNAGYDNIRDVYLKDPDFHKVVDEIKTNLDKGIVTDPETFRKSLAALIGKDKFIKNPAYLTTPANLDNTPTPRPAAAS